MKAFKITDIFIQIVLIVVSLVYALFIDKLQIAGMDFFTGYFVVGSWQVLSVLIHFFYQAPYKKTPRRIYLFLLAVMSLSGIVSYLSEDMILLFFTGLLYFSPVMAIYYLVVCFWETKWLINKSNAEKE